MFNESNVRVVRMDAADLSVGDVLVDAAGQHIGTVEAPPELSWDMVKITAFTSDGYKTWTWRDLRMVRIEIPRSPR